MFITKRGFFSLQVKTRSVCKMESFFSLKGLKPWCCKLTVLLQITGTKAACYGHYITDIHIMVILTV